MKNSHAIFSVLSELKIRKKRHLQIGPSSERLSKAQTPVVPKVAQT